MGTTSYPENLKEVLESIGAAGWRLNDIGAVEAGAGNISACMNWDVSDEIPKLFNTSREIDLPYPSPALVGYTILVTGSGCRLRQVGESPRDNLGAVVVHEGGLTATLHWRKKGNFSKPTSEFNSHLAVHQDQIAERGIPFHAVIHAQPPHLVLLSHIPEYQDTQVFNERVLRWEPETIVQLREGIGFLPFMIPGSNELMAANVENLREYQIVMWAKHGVMARSDTSPLRASDRIEYAETGAMYEYMNLTIGGRAAGLANEELGRVVNAFSVQTHLFK
ncbi:MAG: class II aldolase/adducin family protein [Propionibacteriaceae bacterium]|jgi:rhamnulose-1-phosphate aldolase|nr:class II aldolase/adducin family protein [Propionibacteriaceae bacterium]